ncbi:SDR family NAD(P)-dependent oxidoreductase [Streptomyces sp. CC208A]|uniref:SDR family NAD(P)-dependent oxidoreductase n=1 Tax=Streptomyces sp. CC208A TaxID=3044573 RepID=UPI0024A90AEE|nr:SDR family NAD(P)-dependent oxidoreductase [Streptomyces sp. CC208A]
MIRASDVIGYVEGLLVLRALRRGRGPFAGRTVVVTGAGSGAGRAVARAFGAQGARVALPARHRAGLEAVAGEVRRAGGEALVVPVDPAVPRWADEAADRIAARFGPPDVWVNAAFGPGLAPFPEATCPGRVDGTRAALRHMLPYDAGTVVQVGPAPHGEAHAVDGFTEAVRRGLLRRRSRVAVTAVRLPAAPGLRPEAVARTVLRAARRPRRAEYRVRALPDRYRARTGVAARRTGAPRRPWAPWPKVVTS